LARSSHRGEQQLIVIASSDGEEVGISRRWRRRRDRCANWEEKFRRVRYCVRQNKYITGMGVGRLFPKGAIVDFCRGVATVVKYISCFKFPKTEKTFFYQNVNRRLSKSGGGQVSSLSPLFPTPMITATCKATVSEELGTLAAPWFASGKLCKKHTGSCLVSFFWSRRKRARFLKSKISRVHG